MRVVLAAVAAALAMPLLPLVAGNTVMTDSGNPITFTSTNGNEWWVQVQLGAQGAGSVSAVDAMDTGGPWTPMTAHSDWGFGTWAASFHVEPGHQVRFRASWPGGAQQVSCWFTHPQGVEQCGTSSTSTTTTAPPPSGFTADFTDVRGNEWWEQAQVTPDAGHTVRSADVRVNGGPWSPLQHQSWGVRVWAGSYHAVDGSTVQMRATATTGEVWVGPCFRWIPPSNGGAIQVDCGSSPPPPPPPGSSVFYDSFVGNEWWIQAKAHSKSPISGVDARVNGGTWIAMTSHDYGWAVSTHAPPGSHVQFRARFPDGTYAFIPNGYVWTQATQWPPQSSTFDARFENTDHGNWNWVQANVYAASNWGLSGVSASVNGGPWQALRQQPWGDWAAPIKADNGSYVRFRAESGQTLVSGQYVWPSGRAVGAWPVEGSFVSYALDSGFGSPGGGYAIETHATLRLTYHAGAWSGTCVGRTQESNQPDPQGPYVVYHDYNWTAPVNEGPPTGPTQPVLDATTNLHPLQVSPDAQSDGGSCGHTEVITMPVGMERFQTRLKDRDGHALVLPVQAAHHDPSDYTPVSDDDYWDPHLGLLVGWFHSAEDKGGWDGLMTDTDAPIR